MSYLGFPRLHFAGSFQADVSTVNNDPAHFDTATFQARFQQRQSGPEPDEMNGWWNPRGSGAWRLRGCRVTSALYADGTLAGSPLADPIVGGLLAQQNDQVSAKLVDLDPEQQMVSTIWGLSLRLQDGAGRSIFSGEFAPAPFSDIWARFSAGRPDSFFGATYQSVITNVQWAEALDSPLLQQLHDASAAGMLSIKFNVDGFDDEADSPTFTWGRMVGAIGPYLAGEPRHFVAARLLRQPPGANTPFNQAPCRIDEQSKTLFVDLGNSVPTTRVGGPLQELGPLQVAALPASGAPIVLAALESTAGGFYEYQAGIISARLGEQQLAAALQNPIGLIDQSGATTYLAENDRATYLRADEFVFRLAPGTDGNTASTTIYATQLGKPATGVQIGAWHDSSAMQGQVDQGPVPGPPVGVPESALTIPDSVTTGADGTATLTLSATPPANPRGYIDGQIYGVGYGWGGDGTAAGGNQLSVLVFDEYRVPERPTWLADVQPVLQQYANLYPIMGDIVDLAGYHSVLRHRRMLRVAFGLPMSDPNYMPVTRDLSPGKQAMLLKWLAEPDPPLFEIVDLDGLRRVLQVAIALEHATLPPYLCALFSIKPRQNSEVAAIIRSVVQQEMLHMALACNLLNAVGGEPQIARPQFVPKFPGHLPGGLRPDLTVSLRRCSLAQIRDVFMAIEEPEETLTDVTGAAIVRTPIDTRQVTVTAEGAPESADDALKQLEAAVEGTQHNPFTIGWFYNRISRAIIDLERAGVKVFVGDPSRQLTPQSWPDAPGRLYRVTDRRSALLAIHEVVRQGEGTSLRDPADSRAEVAHYFRFKEIVEGRELVKNAAGEWVFEGPRIRFDPEGVYPMLDDPDPALLPPGSPAADAARLFDAGYGNLLRSLQQVVNGAPERLNEAVGVMFSLEVQARELLRIPVAPGSPQTAGPSFQAT